MNAACNYVDISASLSISLYYTQTHKHTPTQWPSHFLRRVTFSLPLSSSVSPPALCRCGDKISIPFLSLLPSMAGQEVRTTGTEKSRKREREKKQKRKMLTKEDIKRKRKKTESSRHRKRV